MAGACVRPARFRRVALAVALAPDRARRKICAADLDSARVRPCSLAGSKARRRSSKVHAVATARTLVPAKIGGKECVVGLVPARVRRCNRVGSKARKDNKDQGMAPVPVLALVIVRTNAARKARTVVSELSVIASQP